MASNITKQIQHQLSHIIQLSDKIIIIPANATTLMTSPGRMLWLQIRSCSCVSRRTASLQLSYRQTLTSINTSLSDTCVNQRLQHVLNTAASAISTLHCWDYMTDRHSNSQPSVDMRQTTHSASHLLILHTMWPHRPHCMHGAKRLPST